MYFKSSVQLIKTMDCVKPHFLLVVYAFENQTLFLQTFSRVFILYLWLLVNKCSSYPERICLKILGGFWWWQNVGFCLSKHKIINIARAIVNRLVVSPGWNQILKLHLLNCSYYLIVVVLFVQLLKHRGCRFLNRLETCKYFLQVFSLLSQNRVS